MKIPARTLALLAIALPLYAAYLTLGYYLMPETLVYGTAATINTFQKLDAGNSPAGWPFVSNVVHPAGPG